MSAGGPTYHGPDPDALLAQLADRRRAYLEAREALREAILAVCGPGHRAVQHRDRRPPWCKRCGMSDDGLIRRPLVTP